MLGSRAFGRGLRRLLLGVGAAATRPSTRKIRPNVPLSPKATELPCGNEMTRCANSGHV